jgi:hypothetical protein
MAWALRLGRTGMVCMLPKGVANVQQVVLVTSDRCPCWATRAITHQQVDPGGPATPCDYLTGTAAVPLVLGRQPQIHSSLTAAPAAEK